MTALISFKSLHILPTKFKFGILSSLLWAVGILHHYTINNIAHKNDFSFSWGFWSFFSHVKAVGCHGTISNPSNVSEQDKLLGVEGTSLCVSSPVLSSNTGGRNTENPRVTRGGRGDRLSSSQAHVAQWPRRDMGSIPPVAELASHWLCWGHVCRGKQTWLSSPLGLVITDA